MTNPDWYRYDELEGCLILTSIAPPEAIRSYDEFYSELNTLGLTIE